MSNEKRLTSEEFKKMFEVVELTLGDKRCEPLYDVKAKYALQQLRGHICALEFELVVMHDSFETERQMLKDALRESVECYEEERQLLRAELADMRKVFDAAPLR